MRLTNKRCKTKHALLIALSTTFVFGVICQTALANTSALPSDVRERANWLMDVDTLDFLGQCEVVMPGDPDYTGTYLFSDLDYSGFSEAERRMIGQVELPSGESILIGTLFQHLARQHNATGTIPDDGLEIKFMWGEHHLSKERTDMLRDADDATIVEELRWSMNPGTGMLLRNINNPEWRPLGIHISPVAGEEAYREFPEYSSAFVMEAEGAEIVPAVFRYYNIVIFGEGPGSILFEGETGIEVDPATV